MLLTEQNYYEKESNIEYCSASQYKDFIGCPLRPGCEERALKTITGEYQPETTNAMLIGSILDALWEGCNSEELADRFPDCVSTRGATKGELKAEFKKAFVLYDRTIRDEKFKFYMSGEKQVIMTGTIADLPFKIKMDSFMPCKAIIDLKTTENADMDFRVYIRDSGNRLPFYLAWNYDVQLAIYREIVRQNTGDILPCYIAAVDKKPHPKPCIINFETKVLDDALERVKINCDKINALKHGDIEPVRCNSDECDYCRDNYECVVLSTSEFEAHDDN